MRNICTILALTMAVGCGGDDGKDGVDGAPGAAGPAGMNGKDGTDGDDGANGTNGTDGADGDDGAPGAKGEPGAEGDDGADGSAILKGAGAPAAGLGVEGDLYIDTVSRDVYQKAGGAWSIITNLSGGPAGPKGDPGTPGTNGTDGDDGASVRTGSGAPAAGLGNVGDVYIDSATGDLYAKGAGGWTKTGSLEGPAGADGADGAGVTLRGADWFAFALTAAFADAPQLITSEAYTETSSSATFTFTGASQHGRLAFQTAGSYLPGGVNLSSFEAISLSASLTGGAATKLIVVMADGAKKGCQWDLAIAAGPVYSVDLGSPTGCFNTSLGDPDFTLDSVTQIQIGVQSSAAGARTLTIDDIDFVDSL
jgi:Collagen triple helix repeat (20 copies)